MEPTGPLFRGIDHVALTVADLDSTVAFYRDVLHAELLYRIGPFDAADLPRMPDGRDWSETRVGVAGACISIAMLRIGPHLKLELLHYAKPAGAAQRIPANCDVGAPHLCFEVSDLEQAVAYLRDHGCTPAPANIEVPCNGGCPGSRCWYVRDPFGHQLEVVQFIR